MPDDDMGKEAEIFLEGGSSVVERDKGGSKAPAEEEDEESGNPSANEDCIGNKDIL